MKVLSLIITIPFALCVILFALNNRQDITFDALGLGYDVTLPLYLFTFGVFLIAFIVGGFITWLNSRMTVKTIKKEIKALKLEIENPKPTTGQNAHDFTAVDKKQKTFTLLKNNESFILLQFAGNGCYGSRLSSEEMLQLYEKYDDKIEFVSHFVDPVQPDFKDLNNLPELPWHNTWQPGGKLGEASIKYGIIGTPTFYLISPDNKVVDHWFGFQKDRLKKVLNTLKKP